MMLHQEMTNTHCTVIHSGHDAISLSRDNKHTLSYTVVMMLHQEDKHTLSYTLVMMLHQERTNKMDKQNTQTDFVSSRDYNFYKNTVSKWIQHYN